MKENVRSVTSFGYETRADVEVKLRDVLAKTDRSLISRDSLLGMMQIEIPCRTKRPSPEITRIRRMVSQVMGKIGPDVGWRNIGSSRMPCWARGRG